MISSNGTRRTPLEPCQNVGHVIQQYNTAYTNDSLAYSTQTELINASKTTLDVKKRDEAVTELRRMAVEAISGAMEAAGGLDILLTSESTIIRHLALADWAHGAVPTGQWKKNDQPLGMIAIPMDGRLDTLLRFMRRWQRVFPDVINRPE